MIVVSPGIPINSRSVLLISVALGPDINARGLAGSPRVTPDGKYTFLVSASEQRPWVVDWISADIIERLKKEYLKGDCPGLNQDTGLENRVLIR